MTFSLLSDRQEVRIGTGELAESLLNATSYSMQGFTNRSVQGGRNVLSW